MKLHCPHCGVKGSAEDSYSGRKVKCPKCQGMFEITPDMAFRLPEDATLFSAVLPTPTESPAPLGEVELPITEESDFEETETDGALSVAEAEDSIENDLDLADTEPEIQLSAEEEGLNWEDIASEIDLQLTEGDFEETETDGALSVAEVEDSIENDLDLADTEPEIQLSAEEEGLNWEDIASEIDLQLAEVDLEEEIEEELEGDPADLSSIQDDVDTPAADFGLTVEEEDVQIADESGEDILVEAEEDPAETKVTELTAESPLLDPVDSFDPVIPEQEIVNDLAETTEIAESDEESVPDDEEELVPEDDGIELEPYGIDKEQCWQCGKENIVGEQPFIAKDDRLYCTDCIQVEDTEEATDTHQELNIDDNLDGQRLDADGLTESEADGASSKFSIRDTIRQAWAKTKGAKGAIWAGSAIMYLVLLVIVVGGALLLPSLNGDMTKIPGLVVNVLLQVLTNVFSVIFTAGLLLMGIRKVAGDRISWKMIFQGFSCAGKIIVATILQTIFVVIGLLLLVLPGIYLAIGYTMTIPLIIDKGLAPWQAMEMSRKAIHKIWWKVTGLFIVMCFISAVSVIPLGIGLIWTWPMFFILGGVVYRYLFNGEKEES